MTRRIERGVPFSEIRVKLGRKVPPWEKVKERAGLSKNNLPPQEMKVFRGYYTAQIHILLRRPDLAEQKFDELGKMTDFSEFEKRHGSKLSRIADLVRKGEV